MQKVKTVPMWSSGDEESLPPPPSPFDPNKFASSRGPHSNLSEQAFRLGDSQADGARAPAKPGAEEQIDAMVEALIQKHRDALSQRPQLSPRPSGVENTANKSTARSERSPMFGKSSLRLDHLTRGQEADSPIERKRNSPRRNETQPKSTAELEDMVANLQEQLRAQRQPGQVPCLSTHHPQVRCLTQHTEIPGPNNESSSQVSMHVCG